MGTICCLVSVLLSFSGTNLRQCRSSLQAGGFGRPRNGKKNDQAHPPIHPTAHAGNLAGDEKRVYEFVARRFLACCSKDALGFQTTVDVKYGKEAFYATGKRFQQDKIR